VNQKTPVNKFPFLIDVGEVGALMRKFDWSNCLIGPPQSWPPTLIALVNTIMVSRIPMFIAWGPELVSIYNDAYIQFLGDKHPAALGQRYQDIWSEIWTKLAPMVKQGWAGTTTYAENTPFSVQRHAYREWLWATFSHSPIFDNGVVVGAYGVGMETTAQVVAEKRQRFQLAFVDQLRGLTKANEITAVATELLGRHLGASCVFYAEVDERNGTFLTKATWAVPHLPALPQTGRLSDYGAEIVAAVRSGKVLAIDEIADDPRTSPHAKAYAGLHLRSLLVIPLVKSGQLIATLNLSRIEPYHWTKEDIFLAQDVAERTWAAVERARAETALDIERDRSRDILESMDEAFVLLDRDFRIMQINAGALRFERRPASEIIGRIVWEAWPGLEASEFGLLYKRAMAERIPVNLEHYYTFPGERSFWIDMHAYPYDDGLAVFYRDVTESKLSEQRELAAAQHDALTGLPNRALIFEYASHMLAAARRGHMRGAFLFIDLDRFKPINDLYGHEIGDRLLQEVAKRLAGCVRNEDLVGRLGGDEFIVVLQQAGNVYSPATVAQHLLEALSRPFEIDTLDLAISACIGISQFPQHGTDVDTLLHAADLAMYQAKYESRGNYYLYTPELNGRADASLAIEARVKRALQRDELMLHYQPVIDVNSRQLVGVEALLRLAGDDGQLIGPNEFIPVAESAGLIGQIGEWVMIEACRQHEEWRNQGLPAVGIAINVSPLQFRQRGFAQQLQAIVRTAGMDPAGIQIEVTESTVMGNVDDAIQTLKDIRSAGIRIALDDFGTGYSSLSHLGNLPLDKLKVDQSFVQRLDSDKSSRAITESIIALGRTLDLQVVGEGIESEDALTYLQAHGCDQAQGYFISRPLSAGDFARWCRERY
jgi:diguanylate cyclase (GGDEF)-like protein/PAS domain S-box-containing protein